METVALRQRVVHSLPGTDFRGLPVANWRSRRRGVSIDEEEPGIDMDLFVGGLKLEDARRMIAAGASRIGTSSGVEILHSMSGVPTV
jgi:hypothetical protein